MLSMMFYMILLNFILLMLMMLNFILSKKINKDREKISSFECGFDMMINNRLPFSLQFYLIAIIFLIFDIEIALVLPFVFIIDLNIKFIMNLFIMIMMILLLSLVMEWLEGSLEWFK